MLLLKTDKTYVVDKNEQNWACLFFLLVVRSLIHSVIEMAFVIVIYLSV